MPFDPKNLRDLDRLSAASASSLYAMQPFRRHRLDVMRQRVGYNYSDGGAEAPVPVNVIDLAFDIFRQQLITDDPRALLFTKEPRFKVQTANFESLMNRQLVELNVQEELQAAVDDALCGIGAIAVGLEPAAVVKIEGRPVDIGRLFVSAIDLDDLLLDMGSRRQKDMEYVGYRQILTVEEVRSSPAFRRDARKTVQGSDLSQYNVGGDERLESMSLPGGTHELRGLRDFVEVWNVWLRRENLLLTFQGSTAASRGHLFSERPLRIVDWNGPEGGPVRLLGFDPVRGNVMPKSMMADLLELHLLLNDAWRKMDRQSRRAKSVGYVQGGGANEADRFVQASDGGVIHIENAGAVIRELSTGGVDGKTLAFAMQTLDLLKSMHGLDVLGGLGPASGTLGQDQIITRAANRKTQRMQRIFRTFVAGATKDMAFYTWRDPTLDEEVERLIPGTEMKVRSRMRFAELEGKFEDMRIEIEPYSLVHKSPEDRLITLKQFMAEVIAPFAQLLMQQGKTVDMGKYAGLYAKYAAFDEITDLLMDVSEDQGAAMQGGDQMRQSPVTHRTEERIGRPGGPQASAAQGMAQQMMSNAFQPRPAMAG